MTHLLQFCYTFFNKLTRSYVFISRKWVDTLFKKYYIFFLCTNIFLPKVNLGFGSFYVFEFLNIVLFGWLIYRAKLYANSLIVGSYTLFILLTFFSYLIGVLHFNFFDVHSLMRLMKFTMFIFYIITPFYICKHVSENDLMKVINSQILFFTLAGSYVVFNYIFDPAPLSDYIYIVDNRFRLIGFTGYAIDLSGNVERLFGTTSVSMGVYIAFIFLLTLARYHYTRKRQLLLLMGLLLILEFLTYSRTGVIVLILGMCYYFVLNLHLRLLIRLSFFACTLILLNIAFDFSSIITATGTLGKIAQTNIQQDPRMMMFMAGMNYLHEHPFALLVGAGYGEEYSLRAVGFTHLEGLLPTTLVTSGVIAVVVLCFHFFLIWYLANVTFRNSNQYGPFLYGIKLFVPGWFLSAALSGNTFQTDFYFPVIYFIFMISYLKSRKGSIQASER